MNLVKTHLHEVQELEPLIINDLQKIEEGLKLLENQMTIGKSGRPDVLAVDRNGALVLFELKSVASDLSAISQIIRYYEWFIRNLALLSRPFPEVDPLKDIRLFIVAPEFCEDVTRVIKYIDLNIELVRYISLKNQKTDEIGLVFEPMELAALKKPEVAFRSIDDIVSYFIDKSLIEEFKKILFDLDEEGIEYKPWKGGRNYWIECYFNGETVAYLGARQRHITCQIYDSEKDNWPGIKLLSYEEWVKKCKSEISKYTNI